MTHDQASAARVSGLLERPLAGRTGIVTGAGDGIGLQIARVLSQAGAAVLATDLDVEAASTTAARISEAGGSAAALRLDVGNESDWQKAMAYVIAHFGGLDILVNNAGVFLSRPLAETTLADLRSVMSTNLEGVFLGTKYGASAMKDPDRRARWTASIVNLSSVSGLVGAAGCTAYCMSKGGVRLFSKAAALELAADRIRVNSLHPGIVMTGMGRQALLRRTGGDASVEALSQAAAHAYPIGRVGEPADIAEAALFLASDASSFMTGSELVVDGGMTAA